MPFKKSDNPKVDRIRIWVTPDEKAEIEAAARERHLTVSEFLLRRALGKQAPVRFDRDAIDALAKLVMELKVAYRQGAAGTEGEAVITRWRDMAVEAIYAIWKRQ